MDYWEECVSEALEDAGLSATKEQRDTIVAWVEGAHENYSMGHGHDVIGRGAESDAERELREMKRRAEQLRVWEATTKPCRPCTTTGSVLDGWGRPQTCLDCDGDGRTGARRPY